MIFIISKGYVSKSPRSETLSAYMVMQQRAEMTLMAVISIIIIYSAIVHILFLLSVLLLPTMQLHHKQLEI